ncbi:MAG TPA: RNA polymerase sigma factor [Acidimicrobiales bacterium]|nr:RNA polymerase sigma factor [Acidimicrobiales bacterium]
MAARDRFAGTFPSVLAAARAGDGAALARIFTALAPVVEGYLRLQGAAEPEDLTSEVFLGVFRNLDGFRGDEPAFRSWVFTIAHRRLLDERRRLARRPAAEPLSVAEQHHAPHDVEGTLLDEVLSTERVRELCHLLSPDQRDVLLLRLLADLTIEEIAATLGRTPGAVKQLQRRGLRAVGRILAEEGVPR